MATVPTEHEQAELPHKELPAPQPPKGLPSSTSTGHDPENPPATSRAGSLVRKVLIVLLLLLAVAFVVWRVRANQAAQDAEANKAAAAANRPIPVTTSPVQQKTMPIYLTALGTVTAYNTVTVRSRVDGQIIRVNFREGQNVRKGDLLIEIDPRPYQAALEQAQGQLARDQANSKNADAEAARYTALYNAGVVSKESQQAQVSTAGQATGTIKADQAAIDAARVNLVYTRITSPIDGVVGLRQVDPGNIVQAASTTGLVVVTQMQPISVIFTLPEDNLPEVLQHLRSGRSMPVEAFDRSGVTHLATGTLLTVDNQIDTTTGTDKVKAVFDNREHSLFPNQFVNVRLVLQDLPNALVIPTAAVQTGSSGSFVYVVHEGNPPPELEKELEASQANQTHGKGGSRSGKARSSSAGAPAAQGQQQQQGTPHYVTEQPIRIDITEGNQVIVAEGLHPGDQVVIDGQERLKNGSHVTPRAARPVPNSTAPAANATSVQSNVQPTTGGARSPEVLNAPSNPVGSDSTSGAGSLPRRQRQHQQQTGTPGTSSGTSGGDQHP